MQCLFRENKERIKYFQNVETTRTKAFRTHSEIYDGAFLRKEKMLESRDFHKKAHHICLTGFSIHLQYPTQYSVYQGILSNKTTGGEYGLIIKALEIFERTKKFFLAVWVINIFIRQREKQKHYFFWPQIKFQNCSASESSKRSPAFNLEHH